MSISFTALDHRRVERIELDDRTVEAPAVVEVPDPDGGPHALDEPNFTNTNGLQVLELLGLPRADMGEVELPTIRRAFIRTRAQIAALLEAGAFDTPGTDSHAGVLVDARTATARGARLITFATSGAQVARRLAQLERYVVAAHAAGATHLAWG